jgi:hypothetical protein
MDEIVNDEQLNKWFSTYGVITAERILGKLNITLPHDELLNAIKSPFSFYHSLLRIPLKNVLNGIVLQQANDYHLYVQKLFIDYLLSGESSKSEDSQGASTRESMENERAQLVILGENFHKLQLKQNEVIAKSQHFLRTIAAEWSNAFESSLAAVNTTLKNSGFENKKSLVRQGIHQALIFCDYIKAESMGNQYLFVEEFNKELNIPLTEDLKAKIITNMDEILKIIISFDAQARPFIEETDEMAEQARSYRTQFYDTIIRVNELIQLLPDYKINPEQDAINREPLYFDRTLGGA